MNFSHTVDEFFSTVPGSNFDMCIISTRTKTHLTLQKITNTYFYLVDLQCSDLRNLRTPALITTVVKASS